METKANYLLIGSIVLLTFVGLLGFIIWIVKLDVDRQFTEYGIVFEQSVAGLDPAAEVRFNGIVVGKVTHIMIDPKQSRSVRVTIRVDSKTPITDESVASIEFQGLTGVAYVQIEGGSATAKPIKIKDDEDLPIIASKASSLQELFTDFPSLVSETSITLGQLRLLLSSENRALITDILKNVSKLSGGMAQKTDRMQSIMDNFDASLISFNTAVKNYDQLATTTNDVVDKDVRGLVQDIRATNESVRKLSDQLNEVVQISSGPVTAFTTNTLPEVSLMVASLRDLSATLSRISERLERNPSEFLFQGKQPEYEPK